MFICERSAATACNITCRPAQRRFWLGKVASGSIGRDLRKDIETVPDGEWTFLPPAAIGSCPELRPNQPKRQVEGGPPKTGVWIPEWVAGAFATFETP